MRITKILHQMPCVSKFRCNVSHTQNLFGYMFDFSVCHLFAGELLHLTGKYCKFNVKCHVKVFFKKIKLHFLYHIIENV